MSYGRQNGNNINVSHLSQVLNPDPNDVYVLCLLYIGASGSFQMQALYGGPMRHGGYTGPEDLWLIAEKQRGKERDRKRETEKQRKGERVKETEKEGEREIKR